MKITSIALSSLTILLVLSQLICGLWLQSHEVDPGSLRFHVRFGIGTVVISSATIAVMLIFILKQ